MYLDRELQILLDVPIDGVAEELILEHKPEMRDELLDWMKREDIDAAVDPLPEDLLSVVINQRDIMRELNHDAVTGAAVDDGTATILFQIRRDLHAAANTADAVSSRIR